MAHSSSSDVRQCYRATGVVVNAGGSAAGDCDGRATSRMQAAATTLHGLFHQMFEVGAWSVAWPGRVHGHARRGQPCAKEGTRLVRFFERLKSHNAGFCRRPAGRQPRTECRVMGTMPDDRDQDSERPVWTPSVAGNTRASHLLAPRSASFAQCERAPQERDKAGHDDLCLDEAERRESVRAAASHHVPARESWHRISGRVKPPKRSSHRGRSHLDRPVIQPATPSPIMRRIPRISRPIDRALDAGAAIPRSRCRACAFSTAAARADANAPLTERLRSKIWGTEYAPGREDPYSFDSPMRDPRQQSGPQRPSRKTTASGPTRPVRQVQQDGYEPAKTWHGLEWVGGKQWADEQEQVPPFRGRVTGS